MNKKNNDKTEQIKQVSEEEKLKQTVKELTDTLQRLQADFENYKKRVDKEKAFVLHRRPYRNTSFIVELVTEHYGRVSVVAGSAGGVKYRYRGQL